MNARWAEILAQRAWIVWPVERFLERRERLTTLDKAIDQLKLDTDLFVSQLKAVQDADLGLAIRFPTYEGTVAGTAMHPLAHMAYHEGQISYIQTLYGDWKHT